jgi:DNA-binding NarL/FixJ family response regulator
MRLPATSAQATHDPAVSVAVTAGSDSLRAQIERLARRTGARIVLDSAKFQILLLAIDASTGLPSSIPALGLLAPAAADVCVIWCGGALNRNAIAQLLRAGVAGIVSIDIQNQQFQATLSAITSGLQVIDPKLLQEEVRAENVSSGAEELTERENEVLAMMGEGLSNKEISSRLAISSHTVKFHISSILGKLGAASRTEAVSIGVKSGRLTI